METARTLPAPRPALPDAPILVAGPRGALLLEPDGELRPLSRAEAAAAARSRPPIVCHMPALARRLECERFPALDLLELWAFVRPARFCLPTPRGLAEALELPQPAGLAGDAAMLHGAMRALLAELAEIAAGEREPGRGVAAIAQAMAAGGWRWGPAVLAALGVAAESGPPRPFALSVWERLGEWAEHAPEPHPGNQPVEPAEARRRLAALLGGGAEARPQQADYASAVSAAFLPRQKWGEPNMVLAEAGTGIGKTLGYIAPASLWAEKNGAPVWISTYTRNLQRQLDAELSRLYPDPVRKSLRAVIRKGRENYLCLLNLEDAVRAMPTRPQDATALGLMARWVLASRDGDLQGGDFPGWLPDLVGRGRTIGLTDRRGECVWSACPHFHKCFIEKSQRRARRAEIVVANHALVMIQAARAGEDDAQLPTRLVFDEGHHLFQAADQAFAGLLSGRETAELRHWILGPDSGRGGRARGLKRRLEDLVAGHEAAEAALAEALEAARALGSEGWTARIAEGNPRGPTERFLALVRRQVYARAPSDDSPYGLEAETRPPIPGLLEAAAALEVALARLAQPLRRLAEAMLARLDDQAEDLDSGMRLRIEAAARGIVRRIDNELGGWRGMLQALAQETPPQFVDWFAVERIDGRDGDVGMHRRWIDPMAPFIEVVARPAHGILVTSATLTDAGADAGSDAAEADPDRAWATAEARSGARHLPQPAIRARLPSPFDHAAQTRLYVVTDVRKDDLDQVAAAYRSLFLASGGGALGLFTAISRMRHVRGRIAAPLDEAGLPLLAQYVDGLDNATLVEIFRAEEDACLLGTDAMRDGVDVPGRSLRLIVFDRVPWPRPDILHKARRAAFGGRSYDEAITRLRLKQAYGRLIRRATDRGVFVLLDPMMPSRLATAFPPGVALQRVGLAEAVAGVREFLADQMKDDRDHGSGPRASEQE
ncbi:MAG: ATP-dependent DNA helicase [Dongiaceae bacterium]